MGYLKETLKNKNKNYTKLTYLWGLTKDFLKKKSKDT